MELDEKLFEICEFIADFYKIPVKQMLKGRRRLAEPRMVAYWAAHKATGVNAAVLARWFGKDVSTVRYGIEMIEERRKTNWVIGEITGKVRVL